MKRALLAIVFLVYLLPLAGQQAPDSEVRVKTFTQEEKDNLQLWFHEGIQKMALSEESEARYRSILTYYAVKMARLDDKDQELTPDALKAKLEEYLAKQEAEVREILNPEQLTIHEELYGEFVRSVKRRLNIEK